MDGNATAQTARLLKTIDKRNQILYQLPPMDLARSMKICLAAVVTAAAVPALAKEPPPVPYHGAPLIPWAKKVDEHRFRSPRDYDGTIEYYLKTVIWPGQAEKIDICNNTEVRAVHLRNRRKGRWEGLNVYEVKGTTYIYVLLSDEELRRIERKKARGGKKKK